MSKNNGVPDCSFHINFAPEQFLAEAENLLKKQFHQTIAHSVTNFFIDKKVHTSKGLERFTGPGALLVNDWLEKKFDDPKTQERMEKFFEDNFDNILREAMRAALKHQAKKFAFSKVTE